MVVRRTSARLSLRPSEIPRGVDVALLVGVLLSISSNRPERICEWTSSSTGDREGERSMSHELRAEGPTEKPSDLGQDADSVAQSHGLYADAVARRINGGKTGRAASDSHVSGVGSSHDADAAAPT
eukprot:CAMPEP_0119371784 /NCGR_PEP_ID=MMETSP1334-20130426/17878_1 /TAXON_ID=127549 /ORGANISM="Calcidiscus leptoporus, Strain RCC1130" /LENGTH=125 /DNA_ID=CAMNT_0007389135 /DNA_START=539 /DNA_END=912 /DNA_ORIENTATION=-